MMRIRLQNVCSGVLVLLLSGPVLANDSGHDGKEQGQAGHGSHAVHDAHEGSMTSMPAKPASDEHDHSSHEHDRGAGAAHVGDGAAPMAEGDASAEHHMHGVDVDVSGLANPPTVELQIKADTVSGWNVHIMTEYFVFAPATVNQPGAANEGHAHLYVDGNKVARVYGHWFHLDGLAPGGHVVSVTLNGNDHARLVMGDTPISDRKPVVQQ